MAKVKVTITFLHLDNDGDFKDSHEEIFVCEDSDVRSLVSNRVNKVTCQKIIEDEEGIMAVPDIVFGSYTVDPYGEEKRKTGRVTVTIVS